MFVPCYDDELWWIAGVEDAPVIAAISLVPFSSLLLVIYSCSAVCYAAISDVSKVFIVCMQ